MFKGGWIDGARWEQEQLRGCSVKKVNNCEAEENQESVLFWKPREGSVSRRLSYCDKCCWDARKIGGPRADPQNEQHGSSWWVGCQWLPRDGRIRGT